MSRSRAHYERSTSPTASSSAALGHGAGMILHRPYRRRRPENEELVQLDWTKPPRDNLQEILRHVVLGDISIVTKAQKLAYLNSFAKFCIKISHRLSDEDFVGFSTDEIFLCLRAALLHESAEVRAAALRAIRYALDAGHREAAASFERLNVDLLVARSLDIVLDNRLERIQAIRLVRKFLSICHTLPASLIRPIIAISRDGLAERDYLTRTSWAALCELCLLDSDISIRYGVISCVCDCVLSALNTPSSIIESMVGTVAALNNWPSTRAALFKNGISLSHFLIAPFTDTHFSLPITIAPFRPPNQQQQQSDTTEAEGLREIRLQSNKMALICLLRSWEGLLLINETTSRHSLNYLHTSESINALKSFVKMLYLPYVEVRKVIMEMLFELFYLKMPTDLLEDVDSTSNESDWYKEYMISYNRHGDESGLSTPDDWQLLNDFVAGEAKALLPHFSNRVDLIGNYMALVLRALMEAGLVDALTHLILVADTEKKDPRVSNDQILATFLLAELLQLSIRFLPVDLVHQYHPLPRLIAFACTNKSINSSQRDLANNAISYLKQIHNYKLDLLANASIYLEQQIRFASKRSNVSAHKSRLSSDSFLHFDAASIEETKNRPTSLSPSEEETAAKYSTLPRSIKESSLMRKPSMKSIKNYIRRKPPKPSASAAAEIHRELDVKRIERAIKDSQVTNLNLSFDDWDWPLVGTILSWPVEEVRKATEFHEPFIRRLVQFYKPTSKQFALVDQSHHSARLMCATGLALIDFFLSADISEVDSASFDELVSDIALVLSQISMQNAPHSAILNSARLISSLSHCYFLFLGHISSNSDKGNALLEKANIWSRLTELVELPTHHDLILKLIVSSLDYSYDSFARKLLVKVISGSSVSATLYAIQFTRLLFRLDVGGFATWGLDLILDRLDSGQQDQSAVVNAAFQLLDEVCDREDCLLRLIQKHETILHHGLRAELIVIRFLSHPVGFEMLNKVGYLAQEVERWRVGGMSDKYVKLVEDQLNETLTSHFRNEEDLYGRPIERRFSTGPSSSTVRSLILPHLYGELAKTGGGYQLILKYELLSPFYSAIRRPDYSSYKSVMRLKAAIWSVCHVAASQLGFTLVHETDTIPLIVEICEYAPVLSVRGVAFYGLCLISTTSEGAAFLKCFGWESTRPRVPSDVATPHNEPQSQTEAKDVRKANEDTRRQTWSASSLGTPSTEGLDSHLPAKDMTPAANSILSESLEMGHGDASLDQNVSNENIHDHQRANDSGLDDEDHLKLVATLTNSGSSDTITRICTSPPNGRTPRYVVSAQPPELAVVMRPDGSTGTESPAGVRDHLRKASTVSRTGSVSAHHGANQLRTSKSFLYSRQTSAGSVASSGHSHNAGHVSASDARGYAELRSIQEPRTREITGRQHTKSLCMDDVDEVDAYLPMKGAKAVEPVTAVPHPSVSRHISDQSASSHDAVTEAVVHDSLPNGHSFNRDSLYMKERSSPLVIPMEMSLMFSHLHSHEENQRPFSPQRINFEPSLEEIQLKWRTHLDRDARPSFLVNDGLELHTSRKCISCCRINMTRSSDATNLAEEDEKTPTGALTPSLDATFELGEQRSRTNTLLSDGNEPLHTNPTIHRALVRKEILRHISSLSGSVAAKPAEQALLNLKRKFSETFKCVCLYSEVSLQLQEANFRLAARRFLQELFLDASFDSLVDEAEELLTSKTNSQDAVVDQGTLN